MEVVVLRRSLIKILKSAQIFVGKSSNARIFSDNNSVFFLTKIDENYMIANLENINCGEIDLVINIDSMLESLSILNSKEISLKKRDNELLLINREDNNMLAINILNTEIEKPSFSSESLSSDFNYDDLAKLVYAADKSNNTDNFKYINIDKETIYTMSHSMGVLFEFKNDINDDAKLSVDTDLFNNAIRSLKSYKKNIDLGIAKNEPVSNDDVLDILIGDGDFENIESSYISLSIPEISLYIKGSQTEIPHVRTIVKNIDKDIEFTIAKDEFENIFKKYSSIRLGNVGSILTFNGINENNLDISISGPNTQTFQDSIKIESCTGALSEPIPIDARNIKNLLLNTDILDLTINKSKTCIVVKSQLETYLLTTLCM